MFANSNEPADSLGVPNVGYLPTPAGPVPTPSVSNAQSETVIPTQVISYVECLPLHTLDCINPLSEGCVGPGVVSDEMFSEVMHVTCSLVMSVAGAFVTRQLDVTTMNGAIPNDPGSTLSPSQPLLMVLS